MNYLVIGVAIITAIIVLVVIIKTVKAVKQHRFVEEDIAWQIGRAREMGVPMQGIFFDGNNSMIDPRTGKPVIY